MSNENDNIYLTVWVHGTAGDTDKPCGEVDIVDFTGEGIRTDFINWILNANGDDLVDAFNGLKTERWYKVKILPSCEESEWWFDLKESYILPNRFQIKS